MSKTAGRIRQIREKLELGRQAFADQTGIEKKTIENIELGRQKVYAWHIEAIATEWPQYAYWLVTGQTIPEAGQISPNETENTPKQKEIGNENDQQQQPDDFDHPAYRTGHQQHYHRPGAEEETKSEGP
jgi:transcriptional regulator with XRE-family HTH domain